MSLIDFASSSLKKTIKKYIENFIDANVLFSKDKNRFKCEISIHVDKSIYIKANAISDDAYITFINANEKIKKRLRRFHRKLTDHRLMSKKNNYIDVNEYIIQDPEKLKKNEELDNPVIIAESEDVIKTITVSEALMLMSLNDQNAIFFKNKKTKRLNILFKRSDGNIGWLDPKK